MVTYLTEDVVTVVVFVYLYCYCCLYSIFIDMYIQKGTLVLSTISDVPPRIVTQRYRIGVKDLNFIRSNTELVLPPHLKLVVPVTQLAQTTFTYS